MITALNSVLFFFVSASFFSAFSITVFEIKITEKIISSRVSLLTWQFVYMMNFTILEVSGSVMRFYKRKRNILSNKFPNVTCDMKVPILFLGLVDEKKLQKRVV